VCIVTGGARGIGRAIATMLGATGAKVQSIALACAFPVNKKTLHGALLTERLLDNKHNAKQCKL